VFATARMVMVTTKHIGEGWKAELTLVFFFSAYALHVELGNSLLISQM